MQESRALSRRRAGSRAGAMEPLIVANQPNDADRKARMADVPARIAEHPNGTPDELLPWNLAAMRERPNLAA